MNEFEVENNRRPGRKPNDIPRKGHTIYCNRNEFILIKTLLHELRRIDAARKEIAKAKGKASEHLEAVKHLMMTAEEVKAVTIQKMLKEANIEF